VKADSLKNIVFI